MVQRYAEPTMQIEFCTSWGYDKRAASLAEHLLHTRPLEFPGGITLIPSSGGVFEVTYKGDLIYSKKAKGRFPDHAEIDTALDAVAASS